MSGRSVSEWIQDNNVRVVCFTSSETGHRVEEEQEVLLLLHYSSSYCIKTVWPTNLLNPSWLINLRKLVYISLRGMSIKPEWASGGSHGIPRRNNFLSPSRLVRPNCYSSNKVSKVNIFDGATRTSRKLYERETVSSQVNIISNSKKCIRNTFNFTLRNQKLRMKKVWKYVFF